MRLKSKNKDIVRHIHRLIMQRNFYEVCNEIWYYGEFDFFYDYCRHLQYKFKGDTLRHFYYMTAIDVFFDKHYNANLMNPSEGEPRRDSYLDFFLGKEIKSIKELMKN